MDIKNKLVMKELENVIASFIFEPNTKIIHAMNIDLCNVLKKYGVYNIYPYCSFSKKNNVNIKFKTDDGDCNLEFEI